MLPYWILFAVFAAGAMNTRQATLVVPSRPLLALFAFLMALMIGFRFEVGADWQNYLRIFAYIDHLSFGDVAGMADPAYSMLNWLAHAIGADIWLVNLVCAGLFVWGLFSFCKEQPNPWLGFVVAIPYLVVVVAMGYTRQAAAIGLLLVGLSGMERRSIIRFAIYALIAATFHKTAVALLPLVALGSARQKVVNAGILGGVGLLIFYVFVERGMTIIMSTYVEQDYDAQGALVRVAMNLVPAAIFLSYQKRFPILEAQRKLWRNFSIAAFGTLLLLFSAGSNTIADRLAIYLIPLQIFIFSRLPYAFPNKGRPNAQIVIAILLYSAVVQFVWLTQAQYAEYWVPYKIFPIY